MTWRAPRSRAAAGFTLLEVAVALAIVGIGVVTVLELFSAGLRMETGAGTRARALVLARGVFDQMMLVPELEEGSQRGDFEDGYRWEWRVRQATEYTGEGDRRLTTESNVALWEIEVSVLWPESADREGVYTLRTLKVTQRPPR